jgi:DNA-binding LytR/AlgR family response regulator
LLQFFYCIKITINVLHIVHFQYTYICRTFGTPRITICYYRHNCCYITVKFHRNEDYNNVKYSLVQTFDEEKVIIKYKEMTKEIEDIIEYLDNGKTRLIGTMEGKNILISPKDVLYLESVDKVTFAYTKNTVIKIAYTLNDVQQHFSNQGFFRCSKSMALNIYQIDSLKSESGNRILATMTNKEQVMISRHYAKELRAILKGDR